MANTFKFTIDLDSSSIKIAESEAKQLEKSLNQIERKRTIGGSRAAAAGNDQADYRTTRGITGQTGAASRDFAKQAQGLGGIVHLYATFAANIFAVGAAFTALNNAFKYEKMIEGAQVLEATTGVAMRSIASNMRDISDGALSMQESLKFTALASSAGITSSNIDKLTKVAKGASLALGRDMGDAIDRIIRGVAKLEPELVDELGITVKAMQAYRDYAKVLGVSAESLTSYQKTAAYTLAVIEEGTKKFGDVSGQLNASPFDKFIGELKNVGTTILNVVNKVVTPILGTLSNNIELIFAGIFLTVKSLVTRAVPEIAKIFKADPAVIRAKQEQLSNLLDDIKKNNLTEITLAKQKAQTLIDIEQSRINTTKQAQRERIAELAKEGFSTRSGVYSELSQGYSASAIRDDPKLVQNLKANLKRAETNLSKAEQANDVVKATALKAKVLAQQEIMRFVTMEDASEKGILVSLELQNQQRNVQKRLESEGLAQQAAKIKFTQAEKDASLATLEVAKLRRTEAIQEAQYLVGSQQAQKVFAREQLVVDAARAEYAKVQLGLSRMVTVEGVQVAQLTRLGSAYVAAGTAVDVLKVKAAAAGAVISKAFGWISIIGTAIYALYSAGKALADNFGLINNYTGKLNDTLGDSTNIIETATSALPKYNKLVAESGFSVRSLSDANSIVINTFDQVTESINKQINAFEVWKDNQTSLSAWWDQAFGKSQFTKLKENTAAEIRAAAKFRPDMKDNLEEAAVAVESAKSVEGVSAATKKVNDVMTKQSLLLKNNNDMYKNFADGVKDASLELNKFYEEQDTKNEKLRKVSGFFESLQSMNGKPVQIDVQLKALQGLDENDSLFKMLDKDIQGMVKQQQELIATQEKLNELKTKEQTLTAEIQAGENTSLLERIQSATSDDIAKMYGRIAAYINIAVTSFLEFIWELSKRTISSFFETLIYPIKTIVAAINGKDGFIAIGKAIIDAITQMFSNVWTRVTDLWKTFRGGVEEVHAEREKNASDKKTQDAASKKRLADQKMELAQAKKDQASLEAVEKKLKSGLPKGSIDFTNTINRVKGLEDKKGKEKVDQTQRIRLDLEKLALENELKLIKAKGDAIALNNKIQEREIGFVSKANTEKVYSNKLEELSMQYALDKVNLNAKVLTAEQRKRLSAKEIRSIEQGALEALNQTQETKVKTLEIEKQQELQAQKIKEYNSTIAFDAQTNLTIAKNKLEIDIAGNKLTEVQARNEQRTLDIKTAKLDLERASVVADSEGASLADKQLKIEKQINYEKVKSLVAANNAVDIIRDQVRELTNTLSLVDAIDAFTATQNNDARVSIAAKLLRIETEKNKLLVEAALYVPLNQKDANIQKEILDIKLKTLDVSRSQLTLDQRKRLIDQGGATGADVAQAAYDEADKRTREFENNMRTTVDGVFDSVYGGFDAAIDEYMQGIMEGTSTSFKQLLDTFRNSAAEEVKKMAADQMKLAVRRGSQAILGSVLGIKGPQTEQETMIDLLDKIEKNTRGEGSGVVSEVENTIKGTNSVFKNIQERLGSIFGENGTLSKAFNTIKTSLSSIFSGVGSSGGSSSGGIFSSLLGLAGSFFSGGASAGASSSAVSTVASSGIGMFNSFAFANGGIMSDYGALKLNKYAKGGIANSPQVAVFGEGRMNEAFVPLPDGRSIPVSMKGSSGQPVNNISINITVNSDGSSNTNSDGSSSGFDAASLARAVRQTVKEEILNQQRNGNPLSSTRR
jgi:hypothetical protein